MINLNINGTLISLSPAEPKKLMDYLREDLGLTSVKDGCSKGACGTCTVIVDGSAQKSCVSIASLEPDEEDDFDDEDKIEAPAEENPVIKITTVEGLTEREKSVYDYAFAEAGAVQCGFCTPGMVMAGKALIDKNPNPTDADIKLALRRNICRCTGYVKIIEAIQLAAKLIREDLPIPQNKADGKLGSNIHRIDAREKTLGTGEFVDDVTVPGMIFGKALRTQYPRAKVLKINTRCGRKPSAYRLCGYR